MSSASIWTTSRTTALRQVRWPIRKSETRSMPEYQLDALGWFQFERLCQSLLHAQFQLGVVVELVNGSPGIGQGHQRLFGQRLVGRDVGDEPPSSTTQFALDEPAEVAGNGDATDERRLAEA